MKRLIGLSLVFCLFCSLVTAQSASVDTKVTTENKCCTSVEACAAKLGISVEECKALCKAGCKDKASCIKSTEACAAKMGGSVAECKKVCTGKMVSAEQEVEETQVASAFAERTTDNEAPKEVKVCADKSKACCKKK